MSYFTQKFRALGLSVFAVTVVLAVSALPAMANFSERQKITSTPRGVGAQFGNAVAINGNTMVVGARFDSTTASQAGAAFVFVLSGTTWTQQAVLLAGDGAVADKFGYSVAVSQDTIVVGSYNDDTPLSNGGSAYVFVRNGTTWTFQQKLAASDGTADDEFGSRGRYHRRDDRRWSTFCGIFRDNHRQAPHMSFAAREPFGPKPRNSSP